MPPLLLDLVYVLALVGFLPVLFYQRFIKGKKRGGWGQRFGSVAARTNGRPTVWVHAVSLGEVNATRTLVAEIEKRLPGHDVVISTTTDTGYAAACQQYGTSRVFRYPLDFSFVVRRVLDRIRPAAIVLMELEVWPNMITMATARGIPIGIANGRVTEEKSMRRFRRPGLRGLARSMFSRIAWVGAQDETYAARFAQLGVPTERISVTGNLKYDTAGVVDSVPGVAELAAAMGIRAEAPLIVAGSTGPGEEEMLLAAYERIAKDDASVQLAIVPRKPERFDEVARLIEARGFACVRRSRQGDGTTPGATAKCVVFFGDTMGELRKFYASATLVFVGRSLVPMGGSDVMEVAGLGRAMCFGPYMENFADAVEKLLGAKAAVQIGRAEELGATMTAMLKDATARETMGRAAREVVRRNAGATARTVELLCAAMK
ncbi:MAG: 3-deoxy-D-manno-octulosonic acid transferase [Planctomycetota bacterium]